MAEPKDGCVSAAAGPIEAGAAEAAAGDVQPAAKEVHKVTARVGRPAPDFEASAYFDGGFKNVKLSDYRASGWSSASIPVTSPLSDRPN
jgi:peroxiredoxin (alkyl hydroperoxide reductase subunit C)